MPRRVLPICHEINTWDHFFPPRVNPGRYQQPAGFAYFVHPTRPHGTRRLNGQGFSFDPEIPVNIFEMGLIYDVLVDASGFVGVKMTLTAPNCPAAQSLPVEVRDKARTVEGVTDAKVEVVWDPPWTKDRMSDAAKLQLGML